MKVILFYHLKDWYCYFGSVIFCYNGLLKQKTLFSQKGIELIDYKTFLSDDDKQLITKNNEQNTDINWAEYRDKAVSNLVNIMRTSSQYDNSILIGFQCFGFDPLCYRKGHCAFDFHEIFKSKNCKLIHWIDDIHTYPTFPKPSFNASYPSNYTGVQFILYDEDKDYSECEDWRLDIADMILTPSKNYLEIIKSKYLHKSVFYFYSLDEDWYDKIDINNFKERQPLGLLSGSISQYPIRYKLWLETQNIKSPLNKIISCLSAPSSQERSIFKKEALVGIDYVKHISKYKASFFGYCGPPHYVNLAKIIEILMAGTLGFFEYSPLLKSELGLVAYKHYVSITDKNGKLITDANYYLHYLNSDEGERIAKNGAEYVRTNFSSKKRAEQLIEILQQFK